MEGNSAQIQQVCITSVNFVLVSAGSNVMRVLLQELSEWLGYHIRKDILPAAWEALNGLVIAAYGGWKDLMKQGIEYGINRAQIALRAVKHLVVKACENSPELMKHLAKIGTKFAARQLIPAASKAVAKRMAQGAAKTVTSEVAEQIVKEGAKQALSQASKQALAQSAKSLAKVTNPMAIVADVAQAGLEMAGHKEAGKAVGASGNIAAGAILGSVAGPPGAAVGAMAGLGVWALGEGVGYVIGKLW